MEEFNKLVQDKYMDEYLEKFEDCKSFMNSLNLHESYYISNFIHGLKKKYQANVKDS